MKTSSILLSCESCIAEGWIKVWINFKNKLDKLDFKHELAHAAPFTTHENRSQRTNFLMTWSCCNEVLVAPPVMDAEILWDRGDLVHLVPSTVEHGCSVHGHIAEGVVICKAKHGGSEDNLSITMIQIRLCTIAMSPKPTLMRSLVKLRRPELSFGLVPCCCFNFVASQTHLLWPYGPACLLLLYLVYTDQLAFCFLIWYISQRR
jgi:hypothetical protein